jgi:hypothetical protein
MGMYSECSPSRAAETSFSFQQWVFPGSERKFFKKSSARIYRPSFGHENARFRENMPKTLVFNSIHTVPEFIKGSFSASKQAENAHF